VVYASYFVLFVRFAVKRFWGGVKSVASKSKSL
jgi:hypothetical protein